MFKPANPDELLWYVRSLIQFAPDNCNGAKEGDVIAVHANQHAAPLAPYLQQAATEIGAHILFNWQFEFEHHECPDTVLMRDGTKEQVQFTNYDITHSILSQANHSLTIKSPVTFSENPLIHSDNFKHRNQELRKIFHLIRGFHEHNPRYTYVAAYYPNEALAKASGVTVDEFWEQIAKGCCIDADDPLKAMRSAFADVHTIRDTLNEMQLQTLKVTGEKVNLELGLHAQARWVGGSGRNIPSFEVFITPMKSKTNGWVGFSEPLFYKGHTISDLKLTFKNGKVIKAEASEGQASIESFLALDEGVQFLGEFALVDNRLSKIDRMLPSAVLYIENYGGTFHIALGRGYEYTYHDPRNTDWVAVERNMSNEHQDIVYTGDFQVEGITDSGSSRIIFSDGQFQI